VAMIVGGTAMIVSMLLLQLVKERSQEGTTPQEPFLAIEESPAPI
jgi:hypothetical protein